MLVITLLSLSFFVGSIPFGLILMQLFENRDPRDHGSRNIGMTNVMRTSGIPLGLATLSLDLGKGWLMVFLASSTLPETWMVSTAMILVILGHCYSCYLNFKGGKGVATTAGAILALSWLSFVWLIVVWASMRFISDRSDLSSLAAAVAAPYLAYRFMPLHFWPIIGICLLIAWRHRSNIKKNNPITKSTLQ